MAFQFSDSSSQDLSDVSAMLQRAFGTAPNAQAVDPALMNWKYLEPRPDWSGSRGYVLRKDGCLVAHACAYPVTLLASAGPVRADHMGDWAADPAVPGAGTLIWRYLSELTPVMLTVGGSQPTRQLLPRMRYRQQHSWDLYARSVRPWLQFRTDPFRRGWKQPARILRNMARSFRPFAGHRGWSTRKVQRFGDAIGPVLENAGSYPFVRAGRSPELLNYFLACPAAAFSGYLLMKGQEVQGWFLLSRVAQQVRIADIWVSSGDPAAWSSAYALAAETAAADPHCCEIAAASSTDLGRQAIAANGFQLREAEPVFVYDPRKLLEGSTLQLEMIDGDVGFFHNPAYPYLT